MLHGPLNYPARPVQYSCSYSHIYQCLVKNGKQLPTTGGEGQVELWWGARGRKEPRGHSSDTPASAVLCWQITKRLASLPFPWLCSQLCARCHTLLKSCSFFAVGKRGPPWNTQARDAFPYCGIHCCHTATQPATRSSNLNLPTLAHLVEFCSSLRLRESFQTSA